MAAGFNLAHGQWSGTPPPVPFQLILAIQCAPMLAALCTAANRYAQSFRSADPNATNPPRKRPSTFAMSRESNFSLLRIGRWLHPIRRGEED